jgi:hypothetical protein
LVRNTKKDRKEEREKVVTVGLNSLIKYTSKKGIDETTQAKTNADYDRV